MEYRTIAVYKSAISQTHDPIGSTELGNLPIVSRFMQSIFKSKPPKPKYCSTWSVHTALSYLESLEPLEDLTLKQLSYKTALLLALTSAARAHELSPFGLILLSQEGGFVGMYSPYACKDFQARPPSPQDFSPFISREREDLCCPYPGGLCREDEDAAYILQAARVLYLTP